MAEKQERQASLALIHLLNRGMTMAQAKAYLRQQAKGNEAAKPAKSKKQSAPEQSGSDKDGDDDGGGAPEWLQQS